jgi:hypothetical protein
MIGIAISSLDRVETTARAAEAVISIMAALAGASHFSLSLNLQHCYNNCTRSSVPTRFGQR